ncbi:MAG TPA: lysophospholipase, partial [Ruminococcus sp.]|nr:lysophospholipase [Ruminococcus sp.]
DANGDGKINVADSVTVLQYIANKAKYPMNEQQIENADIDGQKGISGGDAIAIQRIDAGLDE